MDNTNERMAFLNALAQLPLIRTHLIKYAQEILQKSDVKKYQERLIDDVISDLLEEMKNNKVEVKEDDLALLKYGLKALLEFQIPASKMAAKIRSLKGKPFLFTDENGNTTDLNEL
jgi:preprotein translocase subunit SecA